MRYFCQAAVLAFAAILLFSCGGERFNIQGNIEDAEDSVVYLENLSLEGPVKIDSVRLSADGDFHFSDVRPEAPEFYRLRIAGQIINLAIDSTETVTVKAKMPDMARDYEVSGSEDCQRIKELALKQIALQNKIIAVQNDGNMTIAAISDSVQNMLAAYKKEVKHDYIFKDPKALSSYFALFQAIGPYLIFNPKNNKEDIKAFAAVATSWDTFRPGSERGENLHNIAIQGMKNERIIANQQQEMIIDANMVKEANLIDIKLRDNKGIVRSLTELKGKVVLLDFHVFALDDSPARILSLRELYNKYSDKGFEIYQVSLDSDEHFWKQQTAALPWISVWDENGIGSSYIYTYNIQTIPDYFLIDRENILVGRASQIEDIDAAIRAEL